MKHPNPLPHHQKLRLRSIRRRWQRRICDDRPIDRAAATIAIESAYRWLGFAVPEIIFVEHPQAVLDIFAVYYRHPILNWRWWRSVKLLWHGIWILPVTIVGYIFIAVFLAGLSVLVDIFIALIYWCVTLVFTYLPPPRESPLMATIYTSLFTLAIILAVPVTLLLVPSFLSIIDDWAIDWLDRIGILDRRFRERFGSPIRADFDRTFWNEPFAEYRNYDRMFGEICYSPGILNYLRDLRAIDRVYTNLVPDRTPLAKDIGFSTLLTSRAHTQAMLEVSTLEFKLADFPDLDEFQEWWQIYRNLLIKCQFFIPYTKVCIVCDRYLG